MMKYWSGLVRRCLKRQLKHVCQSRNGIDITRSEPQTPQIRQIPTNDLESGLLRRWPCILGHCRFFYLFVVTEPQGLVKVYFPIRRNHLRSETVDPLEERIRFELNKFLSHFRFSSLKAGDMSSLGKKGLRLVVSICVAGVSKCPNWTSPNYEDIIFNDLKVMFKIPKTDIHQPLCYYVGYLLSLGNWMIESVALLGCITQHRSWVRVIWVIQPGRTDIIQEWQSILLDLRTLRIGG